MPPRSKHQLISSDLTCRLQAGEWQVGDKFPTVDEFLDQYDFSRCTIFKGIQQLMSDGYLNVVRGVGTFVGSLKPNYRMGLVVNELGMKPQKSTYAYVLCEKTVRLLKEKDISVTRFLEEKGSDYGTNSTAFLEESIRQHSLHGLIMINCNLPFHIDQLPYWPEHHVPYVTIAGCRENNLGVDFDRESLCDIALNFFARKQRGKIGIIGPGTVIDLFREKCRDLPEAEIIKPCYLEMLVGADPEQEGYRMMQNIWSGSERPDALLVADDIVCKGVAQAVQGLAIRIPEDLLIVHSANSDAGVFYPFTMPKIEYDLDQAVRDAVDLLLGAVKHPELAATRTRKVIIPRLCEGT